MIDQMIQKKLEAFAVSPLSIQQCLSVGYSLFAYDSSVGQALNPFRIACWKLYYLGQFGNPSVSNCWLFVKLWGSIEDMQKSHL